MGRKDQIYYSSTKADINILGEMRFDQMEEVISIEMSEDGHCFTVSDIKSIEWKVCSNEVKIRNKWVCAIQRAAKKPLTGYCDDEGISDIKIVVKKVIQPYIIVPIPSKKCNEDWNYQSNGDDWECDCKEGREQSPIDLPEKSKAISTSDMPNFKYKIVPKEKKAFSDGTLKTTENLKIKLDENMLRIKADFGKVVTPDGAVYFAEEVVFHTPAEHQIDGKTYDMEMQIIHAGKSKGDIGRNLVLSFMFEKTPGVYNKFIDDLDFFNLPNPQSDTVDIIHDLSIYKVHQNSDEKQQVNTKPFSFYNYQGSFTSPPCTEDTVMYVASKPLPLSTTALHLFSEAQRIPDMQDSQGNVQVSDTLPISNRKIQPINGRPVFHFDHTILCGPDVIRKPKHLGHFEKVKSVAQKYFYVSGTKLSGVPNAFLVSKDEAYGTPKEIGSNEN